MSCVPVSVAEVRPVIANIEDARRYLGGISRAGLYNLGDQLEWVKIGGRSFVTLKSLDALIAAGSKPRAA
jgi:hypothetical protein